MSPSDTESTSNLDTPILHIDLDAFFASVEVIDEPSLQGLPVAVGGSGERGVIASASYEARCFGVRSAMPSVVALRKCPQLIILPGRFNRYEEYCDRFHELVNDVTPVYEPLGLDEVFADVSSLSRLNVHAVDVATQLRDRIREELHLDSGIGVARNKLFAKLASKRSKPTIVDGRLVRGTGVVQVDAILERQWLEELPVRALWGVGPATTERLARLGVTTVRELSRVPEETLRSHFGVAMARSISEMAHGRDDRPVQVSRMNKSIGHEETFAVSLVDDRQIRREVKRHAAVVARALRQSSQVARTISVVMRFDDMSSIRRSQSLPFGVDDESALGEVVTALVESIDRRGSVRLLGVGVSTLSARADNQVQLSFVLDDSTPIANSRERQASAAALNDAIDDLRRRYGRSVIGHGADFDSGEVIVERQRGSHAFGPSAGSDIQRP